MGTARRPLVPEQVQDPQDVQPGGLPLPFPSCVPEFFGDTMLVNGLVFPTAHVEQRKYRLRILNACNARFCTLRALLRARGGISREYGTEYAPAGPPFVQIGTEGGFLPDPVLLDGRKDATLLLAPAERADLIVDFSDVPAGSILILYNDAPAPFPMGDPETDYYAGARKNPTRSEPGSDPTPGR